MGLFAYTVDFWISIKIHDVKCAESCKIDHMLKISAKLFRIIQTLVANYYGGVIFAQIKTDQKEKCVEYAERWKGKIGVKSALKNTKIVHNARTAFFTIVQYAENQFYS